MPDHTGKESRWGSLLQRSGGLVDRLTDSVKEVGRSTLLKQGLEARERGNLPAAYWLLDEEFRSRPDDLEVCVAFWDAAVDYDQPENAVKAVACLIEKHASGAEVELACQYWYELVGFDLSAVVSPSALARLLPTLQQNEEECEEEKDKALKSAALISALRAIVNRSNEGLTVGVALRVAELARELDPDSALEAARFCLDSEGLHDVKRRRLVSLVLYLDPGADIEMPEPDPSEFAPPPVVPSPAESSSMPGSAELIGEPTTEHEPEPERGSASPEEGGRSAKTGDDSSSARKHPLWEESREYSTMTPDELEQAKLPPSRPAPSEHEAAMAVDEVLSEVSCEPLLEGELVSELEPELEVDALPLAEVEMEVEAELEAEIEVEAELEMEIEARSEIEPEAEIGVRVEFELEPKLEVDAELEQEAEIEVEADLELEPELGVEADLELDACSRSDVVLEAELLEE